MLLPLILQKKKMSYLIGNSFVVVRMKTRPKQKQSGELFLQLRVPYKEYELKAKYDLKSKNIIQK